MPHGLSLAMEKNPRLCVLVSSTASFPGVLCGFTLAGAVSTEGLSQPLSLTDTHVCAFGAG